MGSVVVYKTEFHSLETIAVKTLPDQWCS